MLLIMCKHIINMYWDRNTCILCQKVYNSYLTTLYSYLYEADKATLLSVTVTVITRTDQARGSKSKTNT